MVVVVFVLFFLRFPMVCCVFFAFPLFCVVYDVFVCVFRVGTFLI